MNRLNKNAFESELTDRNGNEKGLSVPSVSSYSDGLLRRSLREPLVHFLLIGLALFAVYLVCRPGSGQDQKATRIEITAEDLQQIDLAWIARWQRHPTPQELRGLVDDKVHQEILYREALALGLNKEDTIIKRRLAQKMEFLAEDISALREPSRDELKVWFQKNAERFTFPSRISFRHLYFSPDKRGEQTRAAAEQALAKLDGKPADSPDAARLGDPFMFQDSYADRSLQEMAPVFGGQFAKALFQIKPHLWQGPIESGYGWHLVWIDSVTPPRNPPFEEVEAEVRTEWVEAQRQEIKGRMYEEMKSRYEIVLPKIAAEGNP